MSGRKSGSNKDFWPEKCQGCSVYEKLSLCFETEGGSEKLLCPMMQKLELAGHLVTLEALLEEASNSSDLKNHGSLAVLLAGRRVQTAQAAKMSLLPLEGKVARSVESCQAHKNEDKAAVVQEARFLSDIFHTVQTAIAD